MNKIIEETQRRVKFDKEFDIGIIFEYEYDEDYSEIEEGSSKEINNEEGGKL